MAGISDQKLRLHRLIDFARVYRGWNRGQTARALNRDSTKMYPNTHNPKMDILIGLSDMLEWSVDDVVEYIRAGDPVSIQKPADDDFEALDGLAKDAHCAGDAYGLIEVSRRMFAIARTPEQRARACNREHGGWDGLGRYTKALEAACRGLRECPIPVGRRHQLQANLANTHYTLWELTSAQAHCDALINWFEAQRPTDVVDRKRGAFAYYVRGNTHRRIAARQADIVDEHARQARKDLDTCIRLYDDLEAQLEDRRIGGIAHTCRGGLIEVDVMLRARDAVGAVDEILASLDACIDPKQIETGDWLESYGWWCVFGANIALKYLDGRALQQSMAVFTDKALEIASRMDNWALRERVFTMQYALHEKLVAATGFDLPYVVDDDEQRLISGTIGRFPSFRETGWRIFRAAKLVDSIERN